MNLVVLLQGFSVNQPDIHIPIIGNRWLVGIVFLFHIIIGSFTMGALVLAPTFELLGVVRRDARFERYARAVADVLLKIFSLGATLGGLAVITIVALYPNLFTTLITLFFWPMVVAFSVWFLVLAGLLTYNLRWDRFTTRKGLHIAIGYVTAALDHVFLVLIVAVDSFMLTPGTGIKAFFNPSYLPEVGHRFVGNISWSAFFIAGVLAVYSALARGPEDRWYFHWAARTSLVIGFTTLVVQASMGFVFAESINHSSTGALQYSMQGPFAWLWLIQVAFIGVLLVGSNLYFWQSRDPAPAPARWLTLVVLIAALIAILPSGIYPRPLFWVRYVVLAVALLLSLLHWLIWRGGKAALTGQELRRNGQVVMAVTGVTALFLFLLMGIIRETARGPFTIYGQMTEANSTGIFQAPNKGYYP